MLLIPSLELSVLGQGSPHQKSMVFITGTYCTIKQPVSQNPEHDCVKVAKDIATC